MDFFDFTTKDQKDAFNFICQSAGIKLNTNFDAQESMILIDSMQKNLVNRTHKQERWEVKDLDWMNENQEVLLSKFKTLGFIDAILPKKNYYDCVCVLGARMDAMKERLQFLESLIKEGLKTRKIVLLTGERYVKEDVDGSKESLQQIAKYFGIRVGELTEARIFRYLYEQSSLCGHFDLVVINTPQKNDFRPTTKTTLDDFCMWKESYLDVKTALFISTQPYVKYQNAIISEILWINNINLDFDVVGDAYKANSIKTLAGALGSYMWVAMPAYLRKRGITLKSNMSLVEKLYAHQPWLYDCLPMKN